MWQPLTWREWEASRHRARSRISFSGAWAATRVILQDHSTHSWAALTGAWYAPTGAERAMWDQAQAEGRLNRQDPSYRPWLDQGADPLAGAPPAPVTRERREAHNRIRDLFGIHD